MIGYDVLARIDERVRFRAAVIAHLVEHHGEEIQRAMDDHTVGAPCTVDDLKADPAWTEDNGD